MLPEHLDKSEPRNTASEYSKLVYEAIVAAGVDPMRIRTAEGGTLFTTFDILFNVRHTDDPRIAVALVELFHTTDNNTEGTDVPFMIAQQLQSAGYDQSEWSFYTTTMIYDGNQAKLPSSATDNDIQQLIAKYSEKFPNGIEVIALPGGIHGGVSTSFYGVSASRPRIDESQFTLYIRVNPNWKPPAKELPSE